MITARLLAVFTAGALAACTNQVPVPPRPTVITSPAGTPAPLYPTMPAAASFGVADFRHAIAKRCDGPFSNESFIDGELQWRRWVDADSGTSMYEIRSIHTLARSDDRLFTYGTDRWLSVDPSRLPESVVRDSDPRRSDICGTWAQAVVEVDVAADGMINAIMDFAVMNGGQPGLTSEPHEVTVILGADGGIARWLHTTSIGTLDERYTPISEAAVPHIDPAGVPPVDDAWYDAFA
jgi:hypothetical protein